MTYNEKAIVETALLYTYKTLGLDWDKETMSEEIKRQIQDLEELVNADLDIDIEVGNEIVTGYPMTVITEAGTKDVVVWKDKKCNHHHYNAIDLLYMPNSEEGPTCRWMLRTVDRYTPCNFFDPREEVLVEKKWVSVKDVKLEGKFVRP